jgi:tetratricopeptide (TPR) repeat protein
MTLKELHYHYDLLLARNNFREAESHMQEILQVPDQPWQTYLYMPAGFYEAWGDYASADREEATLYYGKALQYRREIGYMATGSGEGMEAMYHIKRIQKKLRELEQ